VPLPFRAQTATARHARARAGAILALLGACAAGVFAAPLPHTRTLPPPLAPLARAIPSALSAPSALDRACGANVDALPEAYTAMAEHVALAGPTLPTSHSLDTGEIAVLEDDGTFFFTDKNGNVNLDVAAAARAFYRTHGDDYDELALWLSSGLDNWLGSPTSLAAAWLTKNDISGIGLELFDNNTSLGLPPRVQTVLTMNGLQHYPDDPAAEVPGLPNYVTQDVLAHEFGHHWLAYPLVYDGTSPSMALLGRAHQHWAFFFDADGSVMEGADWEPAGPDSFVMLDPITRYGPLDQYLMGVRARDEVDSFFVVSDLANFKPPGSYVPISDPSAGISAQGPATRYVIEDIEAANGPRVPDAAGSPQLLRMAFVLIVPHGSAAVAADLAKLETIRAAFPTTVSQYTGGRMTLDASLDSRAGHLVLEHAGLPDTETPSEPRSVGLKVTVEQAGIPIAVRPDGVQLFWRTGPGAPWSALPMTSVAADSFVTTLPGAAAGTTLQYWFRAESDSAGLHTDLPELPLSLPFAFHIGPDSTPPCIVHFPQYEQSSNRLPQPLLARVTDNLGVDSVWCEFSQQGGPQQSLPAMPVGRDSFEVSLGAGAPLGSWIAYRFAARDRSAAGNVGYSNPAFDTLRVGQDVVDDFWNPGPWLHGNVRFNRRDEWHLVESPASPAGTTAWHCGNDSLPYGPYQDAALTSPLVYGIAPGCTLSFMHRYDLEPGTGTQAFDGARVEVFNGAWQAATPVDDYAYTIQGNDQGLPQGAPCWSGRRDDWHEERVDLSPYAPGPVRVRFRMSTDLFVGRGGWWVDDVRFHFPNPATTSVPRSGPPSVELGPLSPNPASGPLRQTLRLPRAANVEWTLYDVAGRRVVMLWRGAVPAGAHELRGALPRSLAAGLYFSRVVVDGWNAPARRIAVLP
jgi:hypothetical protein